MESGLLTRRIHLRGRRFPVPERTTPEAFLAAAAAWPRGFWQRGERWHAFAGAAALIESPPGRPGGDPRSPGEAPPGDEAAAGDDRFEAVRRQAAGILGASIREGGARARFFGGFSFYPDRTGSGPWRGFPGARFVLPALELRGGPEGVGLWAVSDGDVPGPGWATLLARLEDGGPAVAPGGAGGSGGAGCSPPSVRRTRESGAGGGWHGAVDRALRAIRAGTLDKVVLARTLDVELEGPGDPLGLLARLREENRRGYVFHFEPRPGRAFFGAAPELLAALEGSAFHATAVAGTIRRGRDREEDRALAGRLLSSRKDLAEHRIGVRDMAERLGRLVDGARLDEEPRVVRQNAVQHLRTDLRATLPSRRHVLELVGALHPTAAVCGHPREVARDFLRETEAFDRGWYAAPVGWFDAEGNGEFVPALRSAVLQGSRLRLFAGAGIVEGSRAEKEWEETRLKLGPILQVLGVDPRP